MVLLQAFGAGAASGTISSSLNRSPSVLFQPSPSQDTSGSHLSSNFSKIPTKTKRQASYPEPSAQPSSLWTSRASNAEHLAQLNAQIDSLTEEMRGLLHERENLKNQHELLQAGSALLAASQSADAPTRASLKNDYNTLVVERFNLSQTRLTFKQGGEAHPVKLTEPKTWDTAESRIYTETEIAGAVDRVQRKQLSVEQTLADLRNRHSFVAASLSVLNTDISLQAPANDASRDLESARLAVLNVKQHLARSQDSLLQEADQGLLRAWDLSDARYDRKATRKDTVRAT
jgi:hypothetical protein